MPGKIFINYRRDDSASSAAGLRDRLAAAFGAANVFMDVDNLLVGQRFDKELEKALAQTEVFVAVIGPKWMDLLQARAVGDERDYVREQIAAALNRGVLVIPVLIERASLPRASNLPEDIREMVLHQKHDISHEHRGRDVDALIAGIKAALKATALPRPKRWRAVGSVAVVVLGVTSVAAYFVGLPRLPSSISAAIPSSDALSRRDSEARAKSEAAMDASTQLKREQDAQRQAELGAAAKAKADEVERQRLAALKADEDRQKSAAQAKLKADEQAQAADAQRLADGSASRGWLGVKLQNIDDDTAASLGLSEAHGALVSEISQNGPAARSGLRMGDAILTVDGHKISDSRDFARRIAALSPNATAEVMVVRGGKEQLVPVKLGDMKDGNGSVSTPSPAYSTPKSLITTNLEILGIKLGTSQIGHTGVAIIDVESSSDAAKKGLRGGDVIIDVSGQVVASAEDVSKGVAEATRLGHRAVLLRVRNGDQTRFVAVQLKNG